jgi:hypothetical protein
MLTERPCASRKWQYAGTFDGILHIGGQLLLVDWKTAKAVYGDNALQLAAYANAEFYLDDDGEEQPMPPVDGLAVVHIRADGTDKYDVKDPDAAWKDALHVFWTAKAKDRIDGYFDEATPWPEQEGVA